MQIAKNIGGAALALAAASLFMVAPAASAKESTKAGHCEGSNACKGHGSCKGTSNACKGQNACKSQGFVAMTKAQCEQVGGTFKPAEKKS